MLPSLRKVARPTTFRGLLNNATRARFGRMPVRAFSAKTDISGYDSKVLAVLGAQWGDEGKGKLVDILAARYDTVARFNGGANAGHTLVVDGKKFAFHLLPCGMLYEDKVNLIGNGVVLDAETMYKELQSLDDAEIPYEGRLKISDRAHLLFRFHKLIDGRQEAGLGDKNIGTTKKGIGPCYSQKATRNGIRVGELLHWDSFMEKLPKLARQMATAYDLDYEKDLAEEIAFFESKKESLQSMVLDGVHYVNSSINDGKSLLAEGANAALLDVDFGTYPFVTSSPTTAGGICTGLGIAPNKLDTVIGVVKAYTTRVGSGPFPTELTCENGQKMGQIGHEFGTTTGRPRRCGWLDLPVVHYSNAVNGYTSINITKLDVLSDFEELKIGTHYTIDGERLPTGLMPSNIIDLAKVQVEYETLPGWKCDISNCRTFDQLPENAQRYVNRIEELLGVPVSWIGTGPGRDEMCTKGFTAQ